MKSAILKIIGVILLCSGSLFVCGQDCHNDCNADVLKCLDVLQSEQDLPSGELMVRIALHFLNTPYVASTLEVNDDEQLVLNLKELDCTTFVENCLTFNRTIKNNGDFDVFCKELQRIRYRGGIIDGYPSRLHYISDWIADNERKGILLDKTAETGGISFPVSVNYMSTHPESYKSLKTHPEEVEEMKVVEKNLNQNKNKYFYIPKSEIKKAESRINDGDIISFTTKIEGLDVTHMGIAYRTNGILTFIHASSKAGKVIVNPESIADYCAGIKSNTGIMVFGIKN